ncbi:MAG: hypothetical protein GTN40_00380 [Candidatus Aenigmarchaeota archaeon]|nr:hypothetical protein [Candidatus Aenigmarchaeota archaeon]
MKKVIIIHCWEGYPDYCWYQWAKKELEKKGYEVLVPKMPETDLPKFKKWLSKLKGMVGKPSKDVYLIGHSLGCITILRYLESLGANERIGGAVLVAGFTDSLGYKEIRSFFKSPIDFKKIRLHCSKFIAIHSDNDPYVSLKYGDIFKEKLGAKLIVKHNKGHFSGEIENEESCTKLPEVVENLPSSLKR